MVDLYEVFFACRTEAPLRRRRCCRRPFVRRYFESSVFFFAVVVVFAAAPMRKSSVSASYRAPLAQCAILASFARNISALAGPLVYDGAEETR